MSDPLIETRQTYDAISETYARVTECFEPPLMSELPRLAAGSLVADVGCGPGRDIVHLRGLGMRVVGFDLSFGQLRTGGLHGVAQADMRLLPVRSGSVDAVWCQAALLHIPREFVPAVLRRVRPRGAGGWPVVPACRGRRGRGLGGRGEL